MRSYRNRECVIPLLWLLVMCAWDKCIKAFTYRMHTSFGVKLSLCIFFCVGGVFNTDCGWLQKACLWVTEEGENRDVVDDYMLTSACQHAHTWFFDSVRWKVIAKVIEMNPKCLYQILWQYIQLLCGCFSLENNTPSLLWWFDDRNPKARINVTVYFSANHRYVETFLYVATSSALIFKCLGFCCVNAVLMVWLD